MAMEDTEQVVSSSVTLYGVSTFNTHKPYTPVTGVCKAELGTAREVVSRLLKQFASEGLVEIERRNIIVAAPERLARIAEGV